MGNNINHWEKKPIDRMEMMHLLGLIYGKTGGRFEKVGLHRLIAECGKPTVKTKYHRIIKALTNTGMLLVQGEQGRNRAYKWNLQKFGPATLLLADKVIQEADNQARIIAREKRKRRKIRVDNL